jgi:hypothetical protein
LFIPEPETEALEARNQSDRSHFLEKRLRAMTALKVVIRDARTQVVDVMETDVT